MADNDAIITGFAVAAVITGINAIHMPNVAATRASASNNQHIDAARKSNTWIGVAVVVGASLLARMGGGSGFASTVFIIGGTTVVGLDVAHRLANATDHKSGKIIPPSDGGMEANAQ